MSAQDNAEVMRKGYAAFSRGDMDALRNELFTPDIVWYQGGRNQTSGDYRGTDAVLGLFGKLFQLTDGTFQVEVHDVLASENMRSYSLGYEHNERVRPSSTASTVTSATSRMAS